MLRSLLTTSLGGLVLATSLSAQYDLSWELECNFGEPKLHAIPRAIDPADPRSPVVSHFALAYAIAEISNSGDVVLPVGLQGRIQPTRDGQDAGRPRWFVPTTDSVLQLVRAAEGDDDLIDWYALPAELEPGASAKAVCLFDSQVVPTTGPNGDPGAFAFPESFTVQLQGLRSDVSDRGGEVVVTQKVRVQEFTFADGGFSGGSTDWVDASGMAVSSAAPEGWNREMETDLLDAWAFDVEVKRPRPVYVTRSPLGPNDLRSLDERTQVFWYVRFRVSNHTGKPRPFNLACQVRTRRVSNDRLLEQLEDENTSERKKEFLRNVVGERIHYPIVNDDAYRAAAAQEVGRFGAIFGPISFFALPPVADVADDSLQGALTTLRTAPTGTFDVIAVFTDALDPDTVEFDVRIGGVRNDAEWLRPGTTEPAGDFADRKLYQVFRDQCVRFRRFGNDEILRDRFQFFDVSWKPADMEPVDLSALVTGKKD